MLDFKILIIKVLDSSILAPKVSTPNILPLNMATHKITSLNNLLIYSWFPFLSSLKKVENKPVKVAYGLLSGAIPNLFVPKRDLEVAPTLLSSL
jgi:hypothetical protein